MSDEAATPRAPEKLPPALLAKQMMRSMAVKPLSTRRLQLHLSDKSSVRGAPDVLPVLSARAPRLPNSGALAPAPFSARGSSVQKSTSAKRLRGNDAGEDNPTRRENVLPDVPRQDESGPTDLWKRRGISQNFGEERFVLTEGFDSMVSEETLGEAQASPASSACGSPAHSTQRFCSSSSSPVSPISRLARKHVSIGVQTAFLDEDDFDQGLPSTNGTSGIGVEKFLESYVEADLSLRDPVWSVLMQDSKKIREAKDAAMERERSKLKLLILTRNHSAAQLTALKTPKKYKPFAMKKVMDDLRSQREAVLEARKLLANCVMKDDVMSKQLSVARDLFEASPIFQSTKSPFASSRGPKDYDSFDEADEGAVGTTQPPTKEVDRRNSQVRRPSRVKRPSATK